MTRILYIFLIVIPFFTAPVYAQWTEVAQPEGSGVWSLAVNGNVVYAANQGLAARSTDGKSWAKIHDFNYSDPNDAVEISVEGGHVYMVYRKANQKVILKSDDNGISWDSIPLAAPSSNNYYFHGDRIFKTISNLIYKTDNAGQSWELLTFQLPLSNIVLDLKAWNGKLYISTYDGVWVSEDGGDNWSFINGSPDSGNSQVPGLHMYPCGNVMFLENYNLGLYRTYDGVNWELLSNPFGTDWSIGDMLVYQGKIYAATFGSGFLVSDDNGDSWTVHNNVPNEPHRLGIYNNQLCMGALTGFFIYDETQQVWQTGNINLIPEFYVFSNSVNDMASIGQNFLVATEFGEYISSDDGTNYHAIGWKGWGNKFKRCENIIFSLYYYDNYISLDDGKNWQLMNLPDSNSYEPDFVYTNGMIFSVDYFYAGCKKSLDYGQTWETLPTGNINPTTNIIFANGKLFSMDEENTKVVSSSDFGQTWQFDTQGIPSSTYILAFFTDGQRVYLKTEDGSYYYLNGSWHQLSISVDNYIFGTTHVVGYSSTSPQDVWVSADQGQTWTNIAPTNPYIGESESEVIRAAIHHDMLYITGFTTSNDPQGYVFWKLDINGLGSQHCQGTVFMDENANGTKDPSETGVPNIVVTAAPSNVLSFTDDLGSFTLQFSEIGDSIRPTSLPSPYLSVNPAFRLLSQSGPGFDFALTQTPGIHDLSLNMVNQSVFRPGFHTLINLLCKNPGTEPSGGVLKLVKPSFIDFEGATPLPDFVNGDTLGWNIAPLPFLAETAITLNLRTATTAILGSPVNISSEIWLNNATDIAPADNIAHINTTVVASYDPNDKSCEPAQITPAMAADGEWLTYTVRFQNTGNYPASFVRIVDTLSQQFDISSIKLLSTSHPASFQLRAPGILEVLFQDINLPDSLSDELGSHGYAQFALFLKKGLLLGESVENTAYIYFDYNSPIRTNTVQTKVENPSFTHEESRIPPVRFFPNPASQLVHVQLPDGLAVPERIIVSNANGEQVLNRIFTDKLDIHHLPAGSYFVQLLTAERLVATGKLVVQ